MLKIVLFFAIFCLSALEPLSAQQGATSSGGDVSGAGGNVSFSIGQTDYTAVSGSSGTMNQGLQQPYEILVVTGIEQTKILLSCSVYPNPTSDFLMLAIPDFGNKSWSYELFDIQDKLVLSKKVIEGETRISLSGLPNGNYLFRLIGDDQTVKSYKIIKNQ